MIETVGTESSGDYGLNFFSLYSLSFAPSGQDSALDLDFSRLRQQTSLIANITAHDRDLTYEGLQKAVDNLAKMYSDTLDLSSRAGNPDPCYLPISADIADFERHDTSNSLSSFQSSMADSLQMSLISSPVNLHITPLSRDTIPIIPNPIPTPKSSTPNLPSNIRLQSYHNPAAHLPSPTVFLPTPPEMLDKNLSDTVEMRTVLFREPSDDDDELMLSFNALDILLPVPTLELLDGLEDSMDYPEVTTADLSFVSMAEKALQNTLVNSSLFSTNPSPDTELNNSSDEEHENNTAVTNHNKSDEQNHGNENNKYITYQTLEEMYGNLDYDVEASDDEYF